MASLPRLRRRQRTPSTRNQRIGFAFFWLLVAAYAYFIPVTPSFNTESHLYVTFNLVERGTVNIDAFHRRLGDESYWRGHYYSDKAPGLSLLAVPVFAVLHVAFPHYNPQPYTASGRAGYGIPRNTVYLRYAITYVLVIVPSAIMAILLWLFLAQFIPSGWALASSAVYALGTTAYCYAMWYFSHQVCAVLLFGAFLAIFAALRGRVLGSSGSGEDRPPLAGETISGSGRPSASDGRRSLGLLLLAGLLAGYSIISEYPTILIAAVLGVYLLVVANQKLRAAGAYLAGMAPPALLAGVYNLAAFGSPLSTGYMHVHSSLYRHSIKAGIFGLGSLSGYGIQAPTWHSIWEITFGTYRGIFLISPILVLFPLGAWIAWRRGVLRPEIALCAAIVVLYFLMDASRPQDVNGWSGGFSVASRHLVPMLPFMMLPIALGLQNRAYRVVFVVLGALSLVELFLITVTGSFGGFNYYDQNPLINELWARVEHGHVNLNWGYMGGLSGLPSVAPYLLIAGFLVTRIVWVFRRVRVAGPRPALAPEAA
ncbi:MAG TPA: hypothetical protein VFB58_16675 [Chloroflexota bacterium]|nr:hypothetical protein [Chloroflexota bacterium]